MGFHLNERMVNKLDKDQRRVLWIEYFRQPEKQLLLSESSVGALLVYHYVSGNRLLRKRGTGPARRRTPGTSRSANVEFVGLAGDVSELVALAERRLESAAGHALSVIPRKTNATKPCWRRLAHAFQSSKYSMG